MIRLSGILLLATLASSSWATEGAEFYRINSATNTVISDLARDGVLHWSNAVDSGPFLIERARELNPPESAESEWAPYARGTLSNQVSSMKVSEPPSTNGMVFIPGGDFLMGDAVGDHSTAMPVHEVRLTPFFMKTHEVINREVQSAYQWAYDNGLVVVFQGEVLSTVPRVIDGLIGLEEFATEMSFSEGKFTVAEGKENHPAVYVSWFGSVAYCNYLSLMEGKEPCYALTNWSCDFSKNGYRLPTEAEWEFAGRGGYEGRRFPWGDTDLITHERANYRSRTNNAYDVSLTREFHPDYASQLLRTSPVGAFAPNAYGLYDMCGNVWEWVWDWTGSYRPEPQVDPTGRSTGRYKVFRGGSNYTTAERVTVAVRYLSAAPAGYGYDTGFRIVHR